MEARLHAASMAGSFLAPLRREPALLEGRLISVWPWGVPVHPDRPADAPFRDAAALLAQLHAQKPKVPGLPRHGAVKRVAAALARARTLSPQVPAAARRASGRRRDAAGLGARPAGWGSAQSSAAPLHGDWHLGQMVQMVRPAAGGAAAGVSGDNPGQQRYPARPDASPAGA